MYLLEVKEAVVTSNSDDLRTFTVLSAFILTGMHLCHIEH